MSMGHTITQFRYTSHIGFKCKTQMQIGIWTIKVTSVTNATIRFSVSDKDIAKQKLFIFLWIDIL